MTFVRRLWDWVRPPEDFFVVALFIDPARPEAPPEYLRATRHGRAVVAGLVPHQGLARLARAGQRYRALRPLPSTYILVQEPAEVRIGPYDTLEVTCSFTGCCARHPSPYGTYYRGV